METSMYIAERLRQFRESKNLSQGDIEKRTGLLRCYISRVENGHTVPAVETLEKIARALEMPLYQLFYEDGERPADPSRADNGKNDWASHGKGRRIFTKIRHAVARMSDGDRGLLLYLAGKMANAPRGNKS
jgi:transcriptional regulator with XRE-family HTH domain